MGVPITLAQHIHKRVDLEWRLIATPAIAASRLDYRFVTRVVKNVTECILVFEFALQT